MHEMNEHRNVFTFTYEEEYTVSSLTFKPLFYLLRWVVGYFRFQFHHHPGDGSSK